VVSEKPAVIENQALVPGDARKRLIGLLFAVGGASGQAGGLILSKIGLAGDFPAFSGTWIRILAAVITVWIVTIARGGLTVSLQTLRSHPRAVRFVSIGAFIGPVVAVWLSLVAVQQSPVGIASALTSLAPIFLLPISYFVFGEKITPRAVIGTMVVIAATAVLFLSK
jgi:drug/metabolite transporter (DMT)-like permease